MDPPQLTYHQRQVKVFEATESCRYLGFWATPNGNMAATKQRVLVRTKEVLGLGVPGPQVYHISSSRIVGNDHLGSGCQKRASDLAAVAKKGGAVTAVPPR